MACFRLSDYDMEKTMKYEFPVKNKFHARSVTELDFEIDPMDSDVYVNLDEVRVKIQRRQRNKSFDNKLFR